MQAAPGSGSCWPRAVFDMKLSSSYVHCANIQLVVVIVVVAHTVVA